MRIPDDDGDTSEETGVPSIAAAMTAEAHLAPWMVYDSAPVLIWSCGADGGCTFVNDEWLTFTGRRLDEALDRGWLETLHPDDIDDVVTALRTAADDGTPSEWEHRLRRADGDWRWILNRAQSYASAGAPGAGIVGVGIDITERRAVEAKLGRNAEELRMALAAGNMGTWAWDRRTGEIWRDPNLQALYGLEPEPTGSYDEWVGLVHPDDRAMVVDAVARSVAEGGTYDIYHRIVRPDGSVRWLERRGEAYRDDAGEVVGTRGLVIDVTNQKEAETERERLLAAEKHARLAAEVAARRLAHLQGVTAGLAEARTTEEVAEVIVTQGADGLGAGSGALCLLTGDGDQLEVIRHVGYHPGSMEQFQVFSINDDLPASEALRSGEMVLLRSLDERDARFPLLRGLPALSVSFAIVPLSIDGRPAGAIALGWPAEREFTADDRRFLVALGQHAAQAIERARFYEAEHWLARRQSFLAEASRILGSSLDYEVTSAKVITLAVPTAADSCSLHLLDAGSLRPVARAHADPAAGETIRELGLRAWCLGEPQLRQVVSTGNPFLTRKVDDAHRRRLATNAEHLSLLKRLATRSAMAVPLRAQNETLGVLLMGMEGSGRHYGPTDLPFVEDLASRLASAVSNGRAHQARTEISRTLQHSLLPPQVPLIPGLEVAARYHPVDDDIEVGGDFYDVFPAGQGRWGVIIGDVSGKGVPAASLTALARYTVRAVARSEETASAVLDVLNSTILDDRVDERFCTIALAFVSYGAGGAEFTLSCGGHPLPLLVGTDGEIRAVGRAGTAMGLFALPSLYDEATALEPGESLVFFTDGVVEARSPTGSFAEGLLEKALGSCAGASAEEVAGTVEAALLDFVGGRPRDDTAVLVLRRPPLAFHRRLSPTPQAVTESRHLLGRWLAEHLPTAAVDADDLLLIATELTTNASRVAHTWVHLHVVIASDKVTIDVSDDGTGLGGEVRSGGAMPRHDSTTGRGLPIVAALAGDVIVESGSCGTVIRCTRHLTPGRLPRR